MASNPPCPCCSGQRYRECCAPYHRGEAEPPHAEALMRSRYSAFALREVGYLWKTLHPEHPDRQRPEEQALRELRAVANSHQYPRLQVLGVQPPDESAVARVLFLARVSRLGKDLSFVERSDFRNDGTGWRYAGGMALPVKGLKVRPESLTLATFDALTR